ncbi:MAG: GspE/PulE family protein [Phycisphaerales bacterium JB043]
MQLIEMMSDPMWGTLAQRTLSGGGGGASGSGDGVGSSALMLVSPFLPVIFLAMIIGWAWVVTTIFDKDAQRWYLGRNKWNITHVAVALAALLGFVVSPSPLIAFPVIIVLLGGDLVAYYMAHNKSDRVPESGKWNIFDLSSMKEKAESKKDAKLARGLTLQLIGPDGAMRAPEKDTPEYDLRVQVESILIDGMERRASDITIQPASESAASVVFYVDGVAHKGEALELKHSVQIINYLKRAGGLDEKDFRRRQQGDFAIGVGDTRRPCRLTTSGTSAGMRAKVLFDPDSHATIALEELGLHGSQVEEVRSIAQAGQGVVLVSSPARSGRTATLYALTRQHDAYISNIQMLEYEQAGTIEGVRHNVWDPTAEGPDYATTLRSIIRRDPDVVCVGELPDAATAKEVSDADVSSTIIYLAIKGESALGAVQTFAKAIGDTGKTANVLRGVICQRLVRKLCTNCKVEYQPTPEMLKKLGVRPEKAPSSLYRKGGKVLTKNREEVCPMCQGTGYFGQEGVFEVFALDEGARERIGAGDLTGLRSELRKKRLPFIQEAAVQKVLKGVTTIEEVARVTSTAKKSSSTKAKPAPASS